MGKYILWELIYASTLFKSQEICRKQLYFEKMQNKMQKWAFTHRWKGLEECSSQNSWHQKLQWGWIKYWKAPNLQDCRKNFNNSEQDTFGILPSLRRLSESIPKFTIKTNTLPNYKSTYSALICIQTCISFSLQKLLLGHYKKEKWK